VRRRWRRPGCHEAPLSPAGTSGRLGGQTAADGPLGAGPPAGFGSGARLDGGAPGDEPLATAGAGGGCCGCPRPRPRPRPRCWGGRDVLGGCAVADCRGGATRGTTPGGGPMAVAADAQRPRPPAASPPAGGSTGTRPGMGPSSSSLETEPSAQSKAEEGVGGEGGSTVDAGGSATPVRAGPQARAGEGPPLVDGDGAPDGPLAPEPGAGTGGGGREVSRGSLACP
jgi:hypothetical protein